LAVFVLMCVASLPSLSLTTDEPIHYQYGRKILDSDAGRSNPAVMPVSALNAFPAWLGERLPDGRIARGLRHFQVARLPTLLVAVVLGAAVFAWSRRLYGPTAGLLSAFLFSFDPNLLAHARLITQDVFLAALIVLSLYSSWRFARRRSIGRALIVASLIGLAQVVKYTAIVVGPLVAVTILIYDAPRLARVGGRMGRGLLAKYVVKSMALGFLFLVIALAVINIAFLREYTFEPLQNYQFKSGLFQAIQDQAAKAEWIRVPVPRSYVQGLDYVMYAESSGRRIYLLGQLRVGEGFPGYFLVAYLLKTPIGAQVIFGLSLASLVRRWSWRRVLRQEQFLLVPLFVFGFYFNLLFRAPTGFRFVLMTLPMMHILSGRLVRSWPAWSVGKRVAMGVGLVSIAGSTLSYHPDYLAYFNEIVWDRRLAYRYLADSNLDWGQSDVFLQEYLAAHPEAKLEPEEITDGDVIVRVNNLVGITEVPARFAMLREECTPVATIGHAYLLYRVPCEEGAATNTE